MLETDPCHICGNNEFKYRSGSGAHWKGRTCLKCHTFAWISKPEEISYKRLKSHTDLVDKYSQGYCEICLITSDKLPRYESLEAQHIVEYQDGGGSDRKNIMICCTRCHKLIHWLRTYISEHLLGLNHEDKSGENTVRVEEPKAVDSLADDPPWD
jgi:hypothetical protein